MLQSMEGSLLRVQMEQNAGKPEFQPADLVEITGPQTLYLGEVQDSQSEFLIVSVEHSVDRTALSAIQEVWYRPERR